jgi:tetratricopeptide (TPR) repeat protein
MFYRFALPAAALAGLLGVTTLSTAANALDTWTRHFTEKNYSAAQDAAKADGGVDALSILGWSQFMLDDYGSALQTFRKLEKQRSKDFDALLGVAWVSIKTANFSEAEKYLEKAASSAKAWQRYFVEDAKGWLAMKKGDLAAAEKHFNYEDLLYVDGQKPAADANVSRGWLAMNRGDWDKAKRSFEAGIDRDGKCFFCRDGLARVALIKGNPKEGLAQTLEGLKITGDNNGLNSLLVTVLYALNDPARSVAVYEGLITRHPKNPAFRVGLGYAYLAQNKPDRGEAEFRAILQKDPDNAAAKGGLASLQFFKTQMVKDGWEAYYKGDYEGALKAFDAKRSEAAQKKNPSAEDGRGWSLLALGKAREARDAFRAAIALDPEFFYAKSGLATAESVLLGNYQQAWALVDLGRFDEAKALFQKTRAETPVDLHWLIDDGLAWILFYQKNYDGAEKAFRTIVSGSPDAYLSEKGIGFVAMVRNDYATATRYVSASLIKNPYQVLTSYTVPAVRLLDAGQFKDAKDILDLAERTYPYSADVQFLLARAYAGLKDDDSAKTRLIAAATLAPLYIDPVFDAVKLPPAALQNAVLAQAWRLYYAGDSGAAVKRFEQYKSIGGTSPTALTGRGWAQLAANNKADAQEAFRAALKLGNNADAHAGLGWTFLADEKVDDAEKSFKAALAATPGYVSAQSGLAAIQYRRTSLVKDGWEAYYKADYKKALAAFEAKRDEGQRSKNPAAEDGRGWTLLALGDPKTAAKAFDAALSINPNYYSSQSGRIAARRADVVLYNQAWGNLEAGQFDEAKSNFEKARSEAPKEFQWLIDDGLAWLAFYKKDNDGAEKTFKAIVAKTPEAYLSHKGLGYVAVERKQYDAAVKSLVESYTRAPYQGVISYTWPADKMIADGQFVRAKEILDLGERTYPYSADIQFLLAKALLGQRDEAGAGRKAAAAAALAPLYIEPAFDSLKLPPAAARDALASLAWGLYFARDNEAAIKRFDAALKAGANDPNINRGKAFALFRLGKFKESVPMLEAAAKLEPKTLLPIVETLPIPGTDQYWTIAYSASSSLAWAHYRLGDAKKADELFAATLATNPLWIDALTGRGYAKLQLKEQTEARKFFEEALKISPYYPDARQGLEALKKS